MVQRHLHYPPLALVGRAKSVIAVVAMLALSCLPLLADWSTSELNNDSDSTIDSSKTYTHAIDIGNTNDSLTINGVPFHYGNTNSGTDATHGGSYLLEDTAHNFTGYISSVSGDIHDLFDDFRYNGQPMTLWVNGLQAGSPYIVRFYVSGWAGSNIEWSVNDDPSSFLSLDRSGGESPGTVMSYEAVAQPGGVLAFRASNVAAGTFHFYGFTVEESVAVSSSPILITDLFNTGLGADGRSLATGSADPHYTMTGPQLPGTSPQAMVTVNNAAWISANEPFSRWIGADDGTSTVAAGNYTYTTTFTIPNRCNASSANISGHIFADNPSVSIALNGVRALTSNFHWNQDDTSNDSAGDVIQENANYFSILHGQDAGDGPVSFQKGTNTLVFTVERTIPGASGLRTYGMKGTVALIPPPGTIFRID